MSLINIDDLKSGKLSDLLPEFYELKNSIENSKDRWHQEESVFNHTLSVASALENIFSDNKNLEGLFNKKIDDHTRKDLLEMATIFHDIGKKETIIKDNSFTKCPGHEKIGAEKTKKILKRFNLSQRESQLILDTITNHSEFHHLLNPENQNFQKNLKAIKNKFSNSIYPELIILSYADTVNSKLRMVNPGEFRYRINFYQKEIEAL